MSDYTVIAVHAEAMVRVRASDSSLCALNCPFLSDGQDCHLYRITNDVVADDTYRLRDENKIERNSQCLQGEGGVGVIQRGKFTWEKEKKR